MNIVRRHPETELASWERMWDRFFDRFLEPIIPFPEREWTPRIDVQETEDSYVVRAELPGMKHEDIEVSVRENMLTLTGEKKQELERKGEAYYHSECRYGKFQRTIDLPEAVDPNKVQAKYHEGVLTITMPKSAEVKARKIKIAA